MPYVNGRYVNYAFSRNECAEMVEVCKKAIIDIMNGQAQEYSISTRSVKFISLEHAQDMLNFFSGELRKYEIGSRPPRSVAVVPRDT